MERNYYYDRYEFILKIMDKSHEEEWRWFNKIQTMYSDISDWVPLVLNYQYNVDLEIAKKICNAIIEYTTNCIVRWWQYSIKRYIFSQEIKARKYRNKLIFSLVSRDDLLITFTWD